MYEKYVAFGFLADEDIVFLNEFQFTAKFNFAYVLHTHTSRCVSY